MELTNLQKSTLQLVMRSPDCGEGWRLCSMILLKRLLMSMPDELVEKDIDGRMVRLTELGLKYVR